MTMEYRRPTYQEIEKRVEKLRFFIGALIYCVIGFGGYYIFMEYVHDSAWEEVFTNVWWLPSMVASYYITHISTHWLIAWIPEKEK